MEVIEPNDIEISNDSKSTSLTDWSNPPTLKQLKQDLTDGNTNHQTQVSKVDTWKDNLNCKGAKRAVIDKLPVGKSKVMPKLIRKQAEWRYASLSEPFLSTQDIFNVRPVTFEDKKAAEQNSLVLNNQFNTKLNKVDLIDRSVRKDVNEGTLILRVGWDNIEEEVEVEKTTYKYVPNPQLMQFHQQLAEQSATDPSILIHQEEHIKIAHRMSMEGGIPIEAIPIGSETVVETKVKINQPTVEICDIKNVVIDPSCNGVLSKAKFVIYRYTTSKAELQEDGRYTNLDKIVADTTNPLSVADTSLGDDISGFNFQDEPRKLMDAYEYWGLWDIDGDGIVKPIVATWIGNTLIRMEENPYPDDDIHPFVSSAYLPVEDSIYGEPDGELLIDNQDIVGAVTRGMIDTMARSANGQQGSRKDALDYTNRDKFRNGEDYEYNGDIDPRQAFHSHVYPELPQSAQYMVAHQNADAESMSGVKAFTSGSGITGSALGDSVGGIKSALDATSKRELGILRRLAECFKQVGRKIIAMNAVFLSEEEVVRITNDEFVAIKRDDLAGNFDLELTISTAEADEQKASELAFMLQTMGPNEDPGMRKIILSDIAKLRKMPALAKKIEEYEPQPDPLEVKKAELEVALLEAEVATEQAKAQEIQAQAQLHMAKAKQAASLADKSDLDFIEQETGTTQERELQKSSRQAESNMGLKVLEHNLKQRETK